MTPFDPQNPAHRKAAFLAAVIVVFAVGVLATALLLRPGPGPAEQLSAGQSKAVEALIRDYLRDHPEVVSDALKTMVKQQRDSEAERLKLNIRALAKDLKDDPDSPVANPDGDVTVVEFFDYECPYCKGLAPKLHELIDGDTKVRFVFKDYPVLGPISLFASRAALASRKQDKYIPFHFAMMAVKGQMTEDFVLVAAKDAGLDIERLQQDMAAPEIADILDRNRRLAKGLNIEGTPNFVIGETLIPGAVDISYIKDVIKKERGG
jgi:protein-disulfide isomerase